MILILVVTVILAQYFNDGFRRIHWLF